MVIAVMLNPYDIIDAMFQPFRFLTGLEKSVNTDRTDSEIFLRIWILSKLSSSGPL